MVANWRASGTKVSSKKKLASLGRRRATIKSHAAPWLSKVDLSKKIARAEYDKKLIVLQRKLQRIQQANLFSGHLAVVVFDRVRQEAATEFGSYQTLIDSTAGRSE